MDSAVNSRKSQILPSQAYLNEWLQDNNQEHGSETLCRNATDGEDLVVRLYTCCLEILQKELEQIAILKHEYTTLEEPFRTLQASLGRLYLCGDGYANAELGDILAGSEELRNGILEIMSGMGLILTRGR